jgi:hypothetical protein
VPPDVADWEGELSDAAGGEAPYALLSPEELREVALSFPRRTGISLDGIHVRHLALLPDQALLVLATLILAIEELAALPSQVQRLFIFLIPKATGYGWEAAYHAGARPLQVVGPGAQAFGGRMGGVQRPPFLCGVQRKDRH